MKKSLKNKIVLPIIVSTMLFGIMNVYGAEYTVKQGDSLYTISKTCGVAIDDIKALNNLNSDVIYQGQVLKLSNDYLQYNVKSGDSLWSISQQFGIAIDRIKILNGMSNDMLIPGQILKLDPSVGYIVKPGDSLWIISNKYGISIQSLKNANSLIGDELYVGKALLIPKAVNQTATSSNTIKTNIQLQPVATRTYVVQAGDTVSLVAQKFGISISELMKYNYMNANDWLNQGQIIAINGYAKRTYTVTPGEAAAPSTTGKLVDWFLEGQYIIKRNDVFTIVDVATGMQFKAKMMGGYNHMDIEPITSNDTAVMYRMFNYIWQWNPRPTVIYKDGMNIAASLSGMPHSFDTIGGNNMAGHCDLYLLNSKAHGASVSSSYEEQHNQAVLKAAGKIMY